MPVSRKTQVRDRQLEKEILYSNFEYKLRHFNFNIRKIKREMQEPLLYVTVGYNVPLECLEDYTLDYI